MLIETIATHFDTYRVFFSPTQVIVNRTSGERDEMPASEVTATGVLRLLLREEATRPQTRAAARTSLNLITRKPNETIAAAAR